MLPDQAQASSSRAPKLKISRLSAERIALRFDFDRDIIDDLKSRFAPRDRVWDKDSKHWTCPSEKYEEVKAWAAQHYAKDELSLLPEVCAALPSLHAFVSQQSLRSVGCLQGPAAGAQAMHVTGTCLR
jgi:hypothetical protein